MEKEDYMRRALELAKKAAENDEVLLGGGIIDSNM